MTTYTPSASLSFRAENKTASHIPDRILLNTQNTFAFSVNTVLNTVEQQDMALRSENRATSKYK